MFEFSKKKEKKNQIQTQFVENGIYPMPMCDKCICNQLPQARGGIGPPAYA
jgi:hypothetical protein